MVTGYRIAQPEHSCSASCSRQKQCAARHVHPSLNRLPLALRRAFPIGAISSLRIPINWPLPGGDAPNSNLQMLLKSSRLKNVKPLNGSGEEKPPEPLSDDLGWQPPTPQKGEGLVTRRAGVRCRHQPDLRRCSRARRAQCLARQHRAARGCCGGEPGGVVGTATVFIAHTRHKAASFKPAIRCNGNLLVRHNSRCRGRARLLNPLNCPQNARA